MGKGITFGFAVFFIGLALLLRFFVFMPSPPPDEMFEGWVFRTLYLVVFSVITALGAGWIFHNFEISKSK